MKRFLTLTIALAVVALMLAAGCSDDNGTTNPTGKQTGNANDPLFATFQTGMDGTGAVTGAMLTFIGDFTDSIISDPGHPSSQYRGGRFEAAADSVLHTYHSGSQYWYFYISHRETTYVDSVIEDIIDFTVEDSIQFRHGTTTVQWPDSTLLTGVSQGVNLNITSLLDTGAVTATQDLNVEGGIFTTGDVTINGSQSLNMNFLETTSNCNFTANWSSTYTNIDMNILVLDTAAEVCPASGQAKHTGTMSASCTSDTTVNFNDNWTVTQTFYGDSSRIVAENSTTRWELTELCPDTVVTSPELEHLLSAVKERR